MSALLNVHDIRKHYSVRGDGIFAGSRTLKAVDGVSLTLERNRTLGIVGESGCGKSTTAHLIMGTVGVTSGAVTFEGKPVTARFDRQWREQRRRLQMVYQNPLGALDRRLPVGSQIIEPLAIHNIGSKAERRGRADELFEAVGLRRDLWDRYPHELSGGQRQRVVIARALILNPSLIVCDEPVSALDVSVAAQIVSLLLSMQDRFGVSFLFISHDLKIVRQISQEVAVMYLGRVVEKGDPDQLFHSPVHPYTQALVSAVPTPGRRSRDRILLRGDPPNPVNVPSGCAFHPRCSFATDICRQERPELVSGPDGRVVACHHVEATAMEGMI